MSCLNESSAFKYCLTLTRYVINTCNPNKAYNLLDFILIIHYISLRKINYKVCKTF